MCVKLKGNKMTLGVITAFLTRLGKASGTWGINNGHNYNARFESLSVIWKDYNRGILKVDSFWEKSKEFVRGDQKLFSIGLIYNKVPEFAVITNPATGIVKSVHHRMPLLIADGYENAFLEDLDKTVLLDPGIIVEKYQIKQKERFLEKAA